MATVQHNTEAPEVRTMSHNIEIVDGRASFYSLMDVAWHRLGHVANEAQTIDQALKLANMDWELSLQPVYTTVISEDGVENIEVPDRYVVVRKHPLKDKRDPLGIVGSKYELHHLRDIYRFIDTLISSGATVETLGSLSDGKRAFITVKLPSHVLVGGKDRTDLYVFGNTSFDGSSATCLDLTGVRVVCANTWKVGKARSEKRFSIRHTGSLDGQVQRARELLDLSLAFAGEIQEAGDRLLATSMRTDDQIDVLKQLLPMPAQVAGKQATDLDKSEQRLVDKVVRQRLEIWQLLSDAPTQEGIRDTAWGLYNAVTEWADHRQQVRGKDAEARADRRADAILLGETNAIKDKAMALLLV